MKTEEVNGIVKENPSLKNVFKNKDFQKLWIGQFVSNLGSQISMIIFPLFIYSYTGNVFWLGFIVFFELLPILVISPFAGKLVDSHNRKYVMIISDVLNSIFIIIIAILVAFDNLLPKNAILVGIIILDVLIVTSTQFFFPARMASIPKLVTPEELGMTVSVTQTTFRLILMIGPAVGVAIAAIVGYQYAFVIDGITFIFSFFMVSLIKTDLNPDYNTNNETEQHPSFLLGIKSILKIKTLRYVTLSISFVLFANIQLVTFLVAYEKSFLHMSDAEYGFTMSLLGFSGVIMGIIMAKIIPRIHKPILFMNLGILLFGFDLLPLLIIAQAWQIYVLIIIGGALGIMCTIPLNFVLLRDTTDNIRGQVQSTYNMVSGMTNILGISFGIVFAPIVGLRNLFFINAVIFVLIGIGGIFYLLVINDLDSTSVTQQMDSSIVPVNAD